LFSQENIEYKKFYYNNGTLSSEGTLTDGKPDGYWKSYYNTGILKSEGNRVDFVLDGIWKFYSEDEKLNLSIEYRNGKKDGNRISYQQNIIVSESFKDDKKNGMTYTYDYNNNVLKSINYIDDLEHGWMKEFDNTGRIIQITRYRNGFIISSEWINRLDKNGLRQGRWVEFHENDNISKEEFYINDKLTGYAKYYDKNGNLIDVFKYENGNKVVDSKEVVKVDIKKDYYPNGKLKTIATYKNNIPDGVRRDYDTIGNITDSFLFEDGIVIGEGIIDEHMKRHGQWKDYYKDGLLRAEGRYNDGKKVGKWIYYHNNGNIEQEGYYNENGDYQDIWIWYYSTGELLREETFINGFENGIFFEYSEEGNILVQGNYNYGLEDGLWTYNVNEILEQGYYKNGNKDGEWITKNKDGIIIKKEKFLDGNPDGKQFYYYSDGKIYREENYINGFEDNDWYYYDKNGDIFLIIKYDSGQEIMYNQVKIVF
jgi:antitoxin component YwqK of YwqJK toxin-antitoxin module